MEEKEQEKLRKCIISAASEMTSDITGYGAWDDFQRKQQHEPEKLRAIAQKWGVSVEDAIASAEYDVRNYMIHLGQW